MDLKNLIGRFMNRDQFSNALLTGSLICILLGIFTGFFLFDLIGAILLIRALFRIYSVNTRERQKENLRYMERKRRFLNRLQGNREQTSSYRRQSPPPFESQRQTQRQQQTYTQSSYQAKDGNPAPKSEDAKSYYFTCPTCRKTLRVPKGQGAIIVHCPHCRYEFDAET
jgi:ribosomal protein L37AE/L43A